MKKRITAIIVAVLLTLSAAACGNAPESKNSTPGVSSAVSDSSAEKGTEDDKSSQPESKTATFEYWTEDSPAMKSIISFVSQVTDESSDKFVPEAERIAVFDRDYASGLYKTDRKNLELYTPDRNYGILMDIYDRMIRGK